MSIYVVIIFCKLTDWLINVYSLAAPLWYGNRYKEEKADIFKILNKHRFTREFVLKRF